MRKFLFLFLGVSVFFQINAFSKSTSWEGCFRCHGKQGISSPSHLFFPNLMGQKVGYMVKQMKKYQTGERKNALMKEWVEGLTESQMKEIAKYFSVLSPALALDGLSKTAVEKIRKGQCLSCHGWQGVSQVSEMPFLAGQKASYLRRQLKAFFITGTQTHPLMSWSRQRTGHWKEKDIEEIASFFSKLHHPQHVAAPPKKDRPFIPDPNDSERNLFSKCIMCHKKNGIGRGSTPHLAGQDPLYLTHQFLAFKTKKRKGRGMNRAFRKISEKYFERIANYFSKIDFFKKPKVPKIARKRGCVVCHGKTGVSAMDGMPHLAGQKESYLIARMEAFQKDSKSTMFSFVKGLTKEELKAIAHYYASFHPDGSVRLVPEK